MEKTELQKMFENLLAAARMYKGTFEEHVYLEKCAQALAEAIKPKQDEPAEVAPYKGA